MTVKELPVSIEQIIKGKTIQQIAKDVYYDVYSIKHIPILNEAVLEYMASNEWKDFEKAEKEKTLKNLGVLL